MSKSGNISFVCRIWRPTGRSCGLAASWQVPSLQSGLRKCRGRAHFAFRMPPARAPETQQQAARVSEKRIPRGHPDVPLKRQEEGAFIHCRTRLPGQQAGAGDDAGPELVGVPGRPHHAGSRATGGPELYTCLCLRNPCLQFQTGNGPGLVGVPRTAASCREPCGRWA